MKEMVYQLWGLPEKNPDDEKLFRKLQKLQLSHPARVWIAGLGGEKAAYERLKKLAVRSGAELYLWVPVYSELDSLSDFEPLIDFSGDAFMEKTDTRNGFRFRCPQSEKNNAVMQTFFERQLQDGFFDGLFLDRIRYPSFQYGLPGVLGCFCESCQKAYAEMEFDPQLLRHACEKAWQRISRGEKNPFLLESFDGVRWKMGDELQFLFDARCRIISRQIGRFSKFAKSRGLKVGLDLFTPALGYFAGQNFSDLISEADFVKPMMYLRTNAPAGIPYEAEALEKALGVPPGSWLMEQMQVSSYKELVVKESAGMKEIRDRVNPGAKIYSGFEYNFVPPIACVTPETLAQDIPVLLSGAADGLTAAWDLFSVPDENIDALCKMQFE